MLIVTGGMILGAALGMNYFRNRAVEGKAGPVPIAVGVSLNPTPDWLPEALGQEIAKSLMPPDANYNASDLSQKVAELAKSNPWIREVKVSKRMTKDPRMGEVVVKAVYRQPLVKVRSGQQPVAYIDREAVRLPEEMVPRYIAEVTDAGGARRQECFVDSRDAPKRARPIHYIEIQLSPELDAAPPQVGKQWQCPAMTEGLRLVELMNTRQYVTQIMTIDVRNFQGRISQSEPQLRMTAQVEKGEPTDIRFGRFPLEGADYEVPTEIKLRHLDQYVQEHQGYLAGKNRYIDLRYDELHVSAN